jgi:general secretion pathway protein B
VPTTPPPATAETTRVPPREEAPAPRRQRAEQAPAAQPAARPGTPVVTAPATKASPATAGNTRIHAVNELPQDIRGSLPQLSIGGAMYSPNPASRMLIVNGQLMHEGEKVTPELVLDQIELKRAVLSFRGYRYSINY